MADRATLSPPLRKHLDDGATDERAARVWAAIQRRRRGQHVSRRFWIGTVAVAGAAALVVLVRGGAAPPVALPGPLRAAGGDRIAEPLPERTLLSDGSEIALGAGSTLDVVDNTGRAFVTRLRAGRGTFDVRPGGPRRWTIEAGLATIEVVGTRFTVQRSAREVRVDVARGAVLVHADGLSGRVQRLTAGQSIRIEAPGPVADPPALPAPPESPGDAQVPGPALAPPPQAPSLDALLAEADRRRRAHDWHGAEAILNRVLAAHPTDARAALASFTLGKVLLDGAGRPADAARAFGRCLELAPTTALAEDALARLAEAEAKAGHAARARRAVEDYQRRYPRGQYFESVKRWSAPR